ncbi:MAG: 5'-methylthioadenosine/adenosylhomocysteine nucleosidase [Mycoplasmatales bacterium]
MNILVLSAMSEEIEYILKEQSFTCIDTINGSNLYNLKSKNNVYLMHTQIGKVNASISTSLLLNKYDVDIVVSIGSCGSLNENLLVGDFVLANKLAYHDVDITTFGHKLGKLPNNEIYYNTTNSHWFNSVLEDFKQEIKQGLILTGDKFIESKDKQILINNFDHPLAVEMESCSIVQTALSFDKDVVVLRTISDSFSGDQSIEFNKYLLEVCKEYNFLIKLLLEK